MDEKRFVKTVCSRVLGKKQLRIGLNKVYAELCGFGCGGLVEVTYNMKLGVVSVKPKDEVKIGEVKK